MGIMEPVHEIILQVVYIVKVMRNICLETYIKNRIYYKLAYFLRKIQILRVNNLRILTIKNTKFSGYYLHMNTNI